jgi:hypothetical protein
VSQRLARQPTVGRLTVPYMVDATRSPIDFKELDREHINRCLKHRRCGICGGRIRGVLAFIGPADGQRDCFADPWMHLECARVAMQQCPFLTGRRDWREESGRNNPLLRRYSDGMALYTATDGRAWRGPLGDTHFHAIGPLERQQL